MLVMIVMHLAGVVFSSIAHGENLVRAMLTGRKRAS
jgi:cytochrome b